MAGRQAGKTTRKAGTILEVPDPAQVTRPDGSTVTVVGGRYVVETNGEHTIAGGTAPDAADAAS